MDDQPVPSPDALRVLFQVTYADLVAVLTVVTGSRTDAEDAVQDAFIRVIRRWSTVGLYEDPEAWVRKVAFGYASNRRRKARNGLRAVLRLGAVPPVGPASGDRVDLNRALATLDATQRAAVVLVHFYGLTVEQAAAELGVPAGTVKSRLHRGRAALIPLLREEVPHHDQP